MLRRLWEGRGKMRTTLSDPSSMNLRKKWYDYSGYWLVITSVSAGSTVLTYAFVTTTVLPFRTMLVGLSFVRTFCHLKSDIAIFSEFHVTKFPISVINTLRLLPIASSYTSILGDNIIENEISFRKVINNIYDDNLQNPTAWFVSSWNWKKIVYYNVHWEWKSVGVWLVGCVFTSHSAIFQLYSDGTVVQFPNFDLLPCTQRHGQLGVLNVPSLPRHGHRDVRRGLLPPCYQSAHTRWGCSSVIHFAFQNWSGNPQNMTSLACQRSNIAIQITYH